MKQQPSTPSDERRSELELVPLDREEPQPNVRDIYISVRISREANAQAGAWAWAILLSTLFGLALAVAVVLLISVPLVGVFSVVAMFAIVRYAQFRRVRTALARRKRH